MLHETQNVKYFLALPNMLIDASLHNEKNELMERIREKNRNGMQVFDRFDCIKLNTHRTVTELSPV